METGQLKAAALTLAVGFALVVCGGCARRGAGPGASGVVLAQRCPSGPHCVTGQVDDRYGTPLSGVRCLVRTSEGEVMEVKTDERGVYLIDQLPDPPREVRFAKDGYATDVLYLQVMAVGAPARTYIALQQADEANCTCEPADIFAGQPACPEERCASDLSRQDSPAAGAGQPYPRPPSDSEQGQTFPGKGPRNEMTPVDPPPGK